jgi:NADH:ubiquinone oxidoreductase subunit 6 (subunit J)
MVLARSRFPAALVRPERAAAEELRDLGAVGAVAKPLFNEQLLAFELTSILLLVAIVGAVAIGKRRTPS